MFSSVNYGITDGIDKQNPHMVDGKQVQVMYDDGRHYVRTTMRNSTSSRPIRLIRG